MTIAERIEASRVALKKYLDSANEQGFIPPNRCAEIYAVVSQNLPEKEEILVTNDADLVALALKEMPSVYGDQESIVRWFSYRYDTIKKSLQQEK